MIKEEIWREPSWKNDPTPCYLFNIVPLSDCLDVLSKLIQKNLSQAF